MKNSLYLLAMVFTPSSAFADIRLDKLAGSWAMNCTQHQAGGRQGFVVESYTFTQSGSFELTRQWYQDSNCRIKMDSQKESGTFKIGKENTNNGFNPAGTYETEYRTQAGTELGLLWVNETYTKLRVSRGFGGSQNTMLGLFEYKKF